MLYRLENVERKPEKFNKGGIMKIIKLLISIFLMAVVLVLFIGFTNGENVLSIEGILNAFGVVADKAQFILETLKNSIVAIF